MDKVYEELYEAKAEIERLRTEYQQKLELSDSLRRIHNEQSIKIQEAGSKLEKQTWELNERASELFSFRQTNEELKCTLKEKEAVIKCLASANDKLRLDSEAKLKKCEEEYRRLAAALDEANEKNMDQESQIHSLEEEAKGLKELVSVSQRKHSEAANKAKESKESGVRDDMIFKLEEENRTAQDQLKWKKEQFKHLEEAHEKLHDKLQTREKEWEVERSCLLDEIFTLQLNLDSQTRICKDLQTRLQMCNQALAHEESRRKHLEVQLSESRTCLDNVSVEFEEAKSNLECLTSQRDMEIASLRDLLGRKEAFYKEMEYQVRKLEQENKELILSVKELQEARIQEAGTSSSFSKLQNKLKRLEQTHRDCTTNMKSREANWNSQLEKLSRDLNCCQLEIEGKEIMINELRAELECCESLIMQLILHNEESTIISLVLKSEFVEAQLKLSNERALLMKQLERKNADLRKDQLVLAKGCEKATSLWPKDTSLQKELDMHKELLKELESELQDCQSLIMQLTLQNEESSIVALVLKSEILEAQTKLAEEKPEMVGENKDREEYVSLLMEQLDMKNTDLSKAQVVLEEECNKGASLWRKVNSLTSVKKHQISLQKELDRHKELLKERGAELEDCQSLMMQMTLLNEESTIMSLVLKSGCVEAQLKLADEMADMERENKERDEKMFLLKKQVAMKNADIGKAQLVLEEERGKLNSLQVKVSSLTLLELQKILLQREIDGHNKLLKELGAELEECLSMIMQFALQNEEGSILSLVLKSQFVETQEKLADEKSDMKRKEKVTEENADYKFIEQQRVSLQEEKSVESSACHFHLKDLAICLKSNLKKFSDAFDRASDELADKFCLANQIEFELHIWKSIAERLKANIEESHQMRREVEASLLAQLEFEVSLKMEKENLYHELEERDRKLELLQEQLEEFNQELKARETKAPGITQTMDSRLEEEDNLSGGIKERKRTSVDLEKEIVWLEQEWVKKELEDAIFAQIDAEKVLEHEKERLHYIVEDKDQRIDNLQQLVWQLEQEFESSTNSFSFRLSEMQAEIDSLHYKFTTSEVLKEMDFQEKTLIIVELENDLKDRQQKLQLLEETLCGFKEKKEVLQEENAKQKYQVQSSESLIRELNSEKGNLEEDVMRLLEEKKILLSLIEEVSERTGKIFSDDMELNEILGRMVQTFDPNQMEMGLKMEDEFFDPLKENNVEPSPTKRKLEATVLDGERSPLRALNN